MASDDFVSRNGRERRGARDGSDRIARIARWLAQPVKSKAVVELVLSKEDGDTLGRWPREDVDEGLAYRIDAIILDAANDEGTTIGARLAWCTEDGTSWASKGFRARCDAESAEKVRELDGSSLSTLQALQRHTEAAWSTVATVVSRSEERVERILGIQERMIEKVLSHLDTSEKRREAAEAAEAEALELAQTAADAAEQAQADADAAAAGKDDPMGKVIEIATKQLMSGAAGK